MPSLRRGRREDRPSAGSALGPRIALWGLYDIADYNALLVPRILERELRARLPLARIDRYAPLGSEPPISLDGGRPAAPLGLPTPYRKRQLAERHDLVVVTGDVVHVDGRRYEEIYNRSDLRPSEFFVDGLGGELELRCPMVWSSVGVPDDFGAADADRVRAALAQRAHVSVRDEASRERLLAIGASVEVVVIPEATTLAAHAFSPEVLNRRLEYLRALGCFPERGRPVVVTTDAVSPETVADVAVSVSDRFPSQPILFVDLQPARGPAPIPRGRDLFALPTAVTIEDLTAAIANSQALIATARAQALATAFDVPLLVPTGIPPVLESSAQPPGQMRARVDGELDALAAIAEQSWSERVAEDPATPERLMELIASWEERYRALLTAYENRGDRILVERLRFAEIVERIEQAGGELTAEAAERIAELENAVFTARAAEAEARYELTQLTTGAEPDD